MKSVLERGRERVEFLRKQKSSAAITQPAHASTSKESAPNPGADIYLRYERSSREGMLNEDC